MTTLTALRTPTVVTGKPLSRKERLRRRRRRARARARARALARRRAAEARKRAAEAARSRVKTPARTPTPASTNQYPILVSADRHLVDRFSYGWSQSLAREVAAAGGGRRWFERQLAWQTIADPATAMVTDRWWPVLQKPYSEQWADHESGRRRTWEAGFDLSRLSLARKIVSTRQVHEMMSEFWLNHLYIPAGEDRSGVHRSSYEDLVRQHALGNFADMLAAAIVHPAMTGFLTNYRNTKSQLNENLGRELLELHTVGVGAGYGEDGVKDSARLLTGFTLDAFGTWKQDYDPSKHHVGAVTIMGRRFANDQADGRATLDAYLRHLALHERTAARLARKLCVRFVSDSPGAGIVSTVQAAYLTSRGDIKTTLRALVDHAEFGTSRGTKLRTPVEDLVSSARALGAKPSKPGTDEGKNFVTHLGWMSENLGYRPYTWPRPDGPPDTMTAWDGPSRMLRTWENRYSLSGAWWGSKDVTWAAPSAYLPTAWPLRLDDVVKHIGLRLVGRVPTDAEVRAAIAALVDRSAGDTIVGFSTDWKYQHLTGWDYLRIRGTLLNSPDQLLR